MGKTLLDKVWEAHAVRTLKSGQTQLFIGLHLIHEVTSVQAFSMLKRMGLSVRMNERTFATIDHVVPTNSQARPFSDELAEQMADHLDRNASTARIRYFRPLSGQQGIVHVIGPELGLTQPGMTIACGDSHTSTHGALGAIAFGIGTSQVRDVLATQTLPMQKPKIRQINLSGPRKRGVYAKDVILSVINRLGVNGGVGYAYEYAGEAIQNMTIEERLTVCNMSIEGGARFGYVNPDQTTIAFLRDKPFAPKRDAFTQASQWWTSVCTDSDASFDDVVHFDCNAMQPMVTWGTNPGQSVGVRENLPTRVRADEAGLSIEHAMDFMGFTHGQPIRGTRIDVAFIGSCTNSRISDLRDAAAIAKGRKVKKPVRALVVPGSEAVAHAAEAEGLDQIFLEAGFEWRKPGCSMCIALNDDKLSGSEICASSSNRNFIGRQGSATGRTLLMSPAMVAAAAIEGAVVDVREMA